MSKEKPENIEWEKRDSTEGIEEGDLVKLGDRKTPHLVKETEGGIILKPVPWSSYSQSHQRIFANSAGTISVQGRHRDVHEQIKREFNNNPDNDGRSWQYDRSVDYIEVGKYGK